MTRYIFWLGTVMICCTIFFFSSQVIEDSGKISGYVAGEIRTGTEKVIKTEEVTEKIEKVFIKPIRKWAHVWLYFVMGIMLCALMSYYSGRSALIAAAAVALCFLYACTDEFHQLFSSGRGSRPSDVLIDTVGAVAGVLLTRLVVYAGAKIIEKRNEKKKDRTAE